MTGAQARDLAESVGPAPCDTCGFTRTCREQRLACEPFATFVATGRVDRDAPRRPTRATFRSVFHPPRTA